MDQLIRGMFRGDMQALVPPYSKDARQNEAFSRMEDLTEEIKRRIPGEFHALLNAYENAMLELLDAACEDEYVHGYQLGVRMMLAAWPDN